MTTAPLSVGEPAGAHRRQENGVEAPSGKDAAYENFPVGSWLLPAALRPHVARFYAYARAIDDIADSPDLSPDEKVARLDGFARALNGEEDDPAYAKAHAMRQCLDATGITRRHCLDLVSAFKQDAVKGRYASWSELVDYCDRSAAPVGRFLLDLHGGSREGYAASDALCNALQVINHLQDCQDDYRKLDRVYLPLDWMREEGRRSPTSTGRGRRRRSAGSSIAASPPPAPCYRRPNACRAPCAAAVWRWNRRPS